MYNCGDYTTRALRYRTLFLLERKACHHDEQKENYKNPERIIALFIVTLTHFTAFYGDI